jgi:putative ATP-dependent endonuclease of OLD family
MLEAAIREIGAPLVANALQRLEEEVAAGLQPDLNPGADRVLRTAKRFGKARFAQVISKHVASATSVPAYIRNALDWLMADATNG